MKNYCTSLHRQKVSKERHLSYSCHLQDKESLSVKKCLTHSSAHTGVMALFYQWFVQHAEPSGLSLPVRLSYTCHFWQLTVQPTVRTIPNTYVYHTYSVNTEKNIHTKTTHTIKAFFNKLTFLKHIHLKTACATENIHSSIKFAFHFCSNSKDQQRR